MGDNDEQSRRMEAASLRREQEAMQARREAEQAQRDAQTRAANVALKKYLRQNLTPTSTPEPAMPSPDLTPDRQGRLSSKQLVEQALYRAFEGTLIRRYSTVGKSPNYNNPAERAKTRKVIGQFHPEQLPTLDRVDALLARGRTPPDALETGDSPTNGFISSQRGGSAPEESLYHCAMEGCDFTINRHHQSDRLVGVSLSNHRILIVLHITGSSFTPYSLSWDDFQSARLEEGVSGRAVLTLTTENRNRRTATYLLQGPKEELAAVDELINLFLKTFSEQLEIEARRASLHPLIRNLLTAFEKLTNS